MKVFLFKISDGSFFKHEAIFSNKDDLIHYLNNEMLCCKREVDDGFFMKYEISIEEKLVDPKNSDEQSDNETD